ncbi:MAG: YqaA family protein [Neptuniibacter sp.]
MFEEHNLLTLFLSGFISATLLPGSSEALLIWQLSSTENDPWIMWLAVASGNALGGIVTFAMGWLIAVYFPLKSFQKQRHNQAKKWLEQYGPFSLLLSWLPIIGDPLCLVAGWLRISVPLSLLMICIGKALRYAVIVGMV